MTNPKDLVGAKKVNTFLVPDVAILHTAKAMMNGAAKYGAYNWRGNPVLASVYISAADRHIKAWKAGEKFAQDSGVHHLGHAMACLAILLDAEATGNLIDDRPPNDAFVEVLDDLNAAIAGEAAHAALEGRV